MNKYGKVERHITIETHGAQSTTSKKRKRKKSQSSSRESTPVDPRWRTGENSRRMQAEIAGSRDAEKSKKYKNNDNYKSRLSAYSEWECSESVITTPWDNNFI